MEFRHSRVWKHHEVIYGIIRKRDTRITVKRHFEVLFAKRKSHIDFVLYSFYVIYLNKSSACIITFPLPSLFLSTSYFSDEADKTSFISAKAFSHLGVTYLIMIHLCPL